MGIYLKKYISEIVSKDINSVIKSFLSLNHPLTLFLTFGNDQILENT